MRSTTNNAGTATNSHPAHRVAFHRYRILPIVLLSALGASSCDPVGLSGSASMRVDVEVYRGPLSKELPIQRGELIGVIQDASIALDQLWRETDKTRNNLCRLHQQEPHPGQGGRKRSRYSLSFPCPLLADIVDDAEDLSSAVCEFSKLDPTGFECENEGKMRLKRIAQLAKGRVEETLATEFADQIDQRVTEKIRNLADRRREDIRARIEAEVRAAIEETLRTTLTAVDDQYLADEKRAFRETVRIQDSAERRIAGVEAQYNTRIAALLKPSVEKELREARQRKLDRITQDRDAQLKVFREQIEARDADRDRAYANFQKELEARFGAQQAEIQKKVNVELRALRKKYRQDPAIVHKLTKEVRKSLEKTAEEHVKERLLRDATTDLVIWGEPYEKDPKIKIYLLAGRVAQRLRSRGEYWATAHAAAAPEGKQVRVHMADIANVAASYGNQIGARVDALLKQLEWDKGRNQRQGTALARELLASSTLLRDSQPTSYLKLYDWNRAAGVAEGTEAVDRVRMVEQLVNDTYWSKVNTVFATGRGTFTTALIKDNIGNWNLKNYDNAPGELLDAYKQAGLATVRAVTDVAQAAVSGSGAGALSEAFATANKVALGVGPEQAEAVSARLDRLATASTERVLAVGYREQAAWQKASGEFEAAKQAESSVKAALASAKADVDAATKQLEAKVADRDEKESALREAENQLTSIAADREAKTKEYESVRKQVSLLEQSGTEQTSLAERKRQLGKAAEELVELQERERTQIEAVGRQKAALDQAQAGVAAATGGREKQMAERRNKQAEHLKASAALAAAEEKLVAVRQGAVSQIRQILDFHRDIIDAIEGEQVDKSGTSASREPGAPAGS